MRYRIGYFILPLFLSSTLIAQTPIDISGTIKNQVEFLVKSMIVVLAGQGLKDTTGADGVFKITGQVSSITNTFFVPKPELSFNGSNLMVNISDGTKPVSLDIYTLKGAHVASILKNGALAGRRHSIPLAHRLRDFSSSVLIGVVTYGNDSFRFRLVKTGNAGFAVADITGNGSTNAQSSLASAGSRGLDSLKFIRNVIIQGKETTQQEYSFSIDKWIDKFEVKLDLIPYEAIDFGVKEFTAKRIWPDQVGDTLKEDPFAIRKYLDKTGTGPHDYEWWCSEYYSYALRVGGCPFKTSSNPTWMIDANTTLKSWFQSNSQYILKNSIGTFKPLPGDFCHIQDHAAMVWYITDKDTLYTVEANGDLNGDGTFDNQLALVNRGNYKTFASLLGYGRRTGFVGSSHKSISK
jgi:hypothetical protein